MADGAALDERAFFQLWDQICIELEKRHPEIAPFFKGVQPKRIPDRLDTLRLDFHDEFFQRQMAAPRRQKAFEEVVHGVTGAPWRFVMEYSAQPTAAGTPQGSATRGSRVPPVVAREPVAFEGTASAPTREASPRSAEEASRELTEHPLVQKSIDLFKGRIV